jgi:nitrous oxidase accessory protein NosD
MAVAAVPAVAHAATCTPTGFWRDGINLTAAQVGGPVRGTLDATGCNIGVYLDAGHPGSVTNADISGATYYGVVVNGVAANVTGSAVHNIGDVPFDGMQHGNAILYINGARGTISGNTVTHFQKNGITVSGKAANGVDLSTAKTSATVVMNVVTGEAVTAPIGYIAQNGIQISYGADATVALNTVSGFRYAGADQACGVLLWQAGHVTVLFNRITNSDITVYNDASKSLIFPA